MKSFNQNQFCDPDMRQVSTFVFALETAQKHCCLKDETQTDLKVFQFGKTIFSTNSEGVAVKKFQVFWSLR